MRPIASKAWTVALLLGSAGPAWGASTVGSGPELARSPWIIGVAGGLSQEPDSYDVTSAEVRTLLQAAERAGWDDRRLVAGRSANLTDLWVALLRRRAEATPGPLWIVYVGPLTVAHTADGAEVFWHVAGTTVSLNDQVLPLACVRGAPTIVSILPHPRWLGSVANRESPRALRLAGWPDIAEPYEALVWWASGWGESAERVRGRLIAAGELARSVFDAELQRPEDLDWWTNRFGIAERRIRLETGGRQVPWRLIRAGTLELTEHSASAGNPTSTSAVRTAIGIAIDALTQGSDPAWAEALDAAVTARDVGLVSFLSACLATGMSDLEARSRAAVWQAIARLRYDRPAAAELASRQAAENEALGAVAQGLRAAALWRSGQLNTARLLAQEGMPQLGSTTSLPARVAWIYAKLVLGEAHALAGDLEGASDQLQQAWVAQSELVEWFNPEHRATVAVELSRLARSRGRVEEAERWCEKVLSELRCGGWTRSQPMVLFELGNARWAAGRPAQEVLATWLSAAELWESQRGEPAPDILWIQIAELAAEAGDANLSAATLQRLESRAEPPDAEIVPRIHRVRARLAYRLGDRIEALRWLQRAMDGAHALQSESRELLPELLAEVALLYSELNDDERAADFSARALEAWTRSSQTNMAARLPTALVLARARTRQRRYSDAAVAWSNVAALAVVPGARRTDLWRQARREEARAWLTIGQAERALEALEGVGDPRLEAAEAADIALLRGRALYGLSKTEEAAAAFEEAWELARQAGEAARTLQAEATVRLGLALASAGKLFRAQRAFAAAAPLREYVPKELLNAWASAEANIQTALRPHGPVGMYHDLAATAELDAEYHARTERPGEASR